MKRITRLVVVLTVPIAFVLSARLAGQAPDVYEQRRQAVRDAMEPNSVLVVRNTPIADDSGLPRTDPNFRYLTGLGPEGTALILYATKQTAATPARYIPTAFLYRRLPPPSPPGPAGPARESVPSTPPGFAAVRPSSDFQPAFENVLLSAPPTVYLDYRRSRLLGGPLTEDEQLFKQVRDRGAVLNIKSASSLIAPLRVIKSGDELQLLRKAAVITAAAEREAMRAAKPGLFEYQLQSIIEHVFTINGAMRPGFTTIVGSGPNSCVLHWSDNTRQTEAGDVVVMDIGAEYEHYTADITRTIPINGTFSKRQREIYAVVLAANEQAIAMLKPGVTMSDLNAKVRDVLGDGLLKLGITKDKSETMRYALHGPTHPIGLQVHDVGSTAVLAPGMIITIEPGLYLPQENLGIRIEDDVLITPDGHEVITADAPKSIDAIESLMKQGGGIDFRRYLLVGGKITS